VTIDEQARRIEQGRRVRMARTSVPWNQSELAEAVSAVTGDPISRTIIAQIESGRRDAEVGILRGIARTTHLSWEWLSGDKEIPGKPLVRHPVRRSS
jgi:transcriptional regulator with XRE-family HTH domain